MSGFAARLKDALVGDAHARFVYLGDERALLLAQAADVVVLAEAPEQSYLEYLQSLGLELPTIVAASPGDPAASVTENALADESMPRLVAELAGFYAYLMPHGVSTLEEELADRCGLRLATAPARVCTSVNNKGYRRRLARELGLRQPIEAPGEAPVEALGEALGGSPIGEFDEVNGDARHLTYQFTIGRDASVQFDHIGEAIVAGGGYQGSRLPARLTEAQEAEVRRTAEAVGERLARDGYHGVVSIDAVIDPAGGLYPVTGINARTTTLTYLAALRDRLVGPGMVAMTRQYPIRASRPLPFAELRDGLAGLLLEQPGGSGVVVTSFSTANPDRPGRVHAIVTASTSDRLAELDAQVARRIAALDAATQRT